MKRNTLIVFALLYSIFFAYSCSKELSLENSISVFSAEGSLWDSSDNCLPDSVYGTFYTGVQPGADTAYVEIQVNVSVAGNYSISTDLQNGFMFADSGFFATTGINTVQLKPIGTPILIQPTVFTVSFDSSTCFFSVNVQDSTGTGLGGVEPIDSTNFSDTAWKFSVGASTYHGNIESAFVLDTLGLKYLTIVGTSTPTGDTAFLAGIFFTGTVAPGTYTTESQSQLYLTTIDGLGNYTIIYQADPSTSATAVTSITIVSYNSSTGIISGTFNGNAVDGSGNTITISNGSFKAKIT
ncbi:hypothetical protein BH10BAC2_BH10BAC2_34500 [soil metagenome]